jgi:pimeloyl-ACP methyl ester carboxylesterase
MKIIIDGQLIEYKDEGSGRVILLLHGWGTNLDTFEQLSSHFVRNFRVIRFDFPGFGQSPKPANDWSVSDYAKITRDLLQKLKVKEIHAIIAHSFGGRIVIKGVSLDYFQPQKIVLIGTAGVKPRQSFKKNVYKGIAKAGKFATSLPILNKAQPALRKRLYSAAGSTDYLHAGQMRKIFLNTINEDLLPEVAQISQPTLMIWGQNDTETPLKDANSMLKLLKNGRLVVIPNMGHFVYIEANDKVVKELESFLV